MAVGNFERLVQLGEDVGHLVEQFTSNEAHRAEPLAESVAGHGVHVRRPARRLRWIAASSRRAGDEARKDVARSRCAEPWRRLWCQPTSLVVRRHVAETGDHGVQLVRYGPRPVVGVGRHAERVDQVVQFIAIRCEYEAFGDRSRPPRGSPN